MQNLVQTAVSEVMSTEVRIVSPYDSLASVYEVFETDNIRRLPVVEDNDLIGIITLKDILSAKPSDIRHRAKVEDIIERLSTLIVSVAMTPDPVTIYQSSPIGHAAGLMLENKIGGLPVINSEKKLVGIITESDLFRIIVKHWQDQNLISSGVT